MLKKFIKKYNTWSFPSKLSFWAFIIAVIGIPISIISIPSVSAFLNENLLGNKPNLIIILSSFTLGNESYNGTPILDSVKVYENDTCIRFSLINKTNKKDLINFELPITVPTGFYRNQLHEIYEKNVCKTYLIGIRNYGNETISNVIINLVRTNMVGGIEILKFTKDKLLPTQTYSEQFDSCAKPKDIFVWSNEQRNFDEILFFDYIVNYCDEYQLLNISK
jgi:hypothetical protein